MEQPTRFDDEDARKLAIAADDDSPRYLERADGSWSFVDDDGWAVDTDSEIITDRNEGDGVAARQILVTTPPLCDSADVGLAHMLAQQHRACRIHQCVWKAAAHHTLVLSGRLIPQSRSPRERAAARGIHYPAAKETDAAWSGSPTPRTLREVLDYLESLVHAPDDAPTHKGHGSRR